MLSATNSWTSYIVATALAVTLFGIFVWNRQKKKYVRVGKISKLFFYPVKSLKGIEVTRGLCTKYGFEVNGVLDRCFMVVNENGVLVSQREAPSLCQLTPYISGNYLIIQNPKGESLKVEIKKSPSQEDKKMNCRIHGDITVGTDCGDEAATWFKSYLKMEGVRLVRFFHEGTDRKYIKKHPYFMKIRKEHPASFQDFGAFHIVSQASVENINSAQTDKEITVHNFRPNIVVKECEAFAEDSWKYMKLNSGAELLNLFLTTRCILTTNDPETGVLDQKEPLTSLRKYRIPADPEVFKITGSKPCLGTTCAVISCGEVEVGDDINAVVGQYRIPADPEVFKITGSIPCLGTTCAVISCGEVEVGDDINAVVGKQPKMKVK